MQDRNRSSGSAIFPWGEIANLTIGHWHWSPRQMWLATPRELLLATASINPSPSHPSQSDLQALCEAFPDMPSLV